MNTCQHCGAPFVRTAYHQGRCLCNPAVRSRYQAQLSDGNGHIVSEATWTAWTARHQEWLRSDTLTTKVRTLTGRGGWSGVAEFFGLEVAR